MVFIAVINHNFQRRSLCQPLKEHKNPAVQGSDRPASFFRSSFLKSGKERQSECKVRQKRHTILPCAFRLILAFGSLSEIRVLRLFVGRNDDLAFAVIADRISRYAFDILTSGMYDASLI